MSRIDAPDATSTQVLDDLRPLLFSIAYRMLGTVSEAEDVVQEAFLRYERARADDRSAIESPRAFLSTVTTRLAIDQLRSARARRERYVGEWLPEPLVTDEAADIARQAERADSLSMAFLLVLERLSPVERAVFLLHDVFDYDFAEIAEIVGKSPANCRQIAVRARRHVAEERPRFEASRRQREELASRFFAAVGDGDMDGLLELLAEDVVVHGDAGGTSPSFAGPIHGRHRASRLLLGVAAKAAAAGLELRPAHVNGQPGALLQAPDGAVASVMTLDIVDGVVQAVRMVRNPDKLRHLGPVADFRGLLRELARRRR